MQNEFKTVTYPNVEFAHEYKINKNGDVFSTYRNQWKEMSKQQISKGYLRVGLTTTTGRKFFMIHRLVMEAYSPVDNSLELEVNHLDGNKTNNNIENLEWCTGSCNVRHSLDTGLKIPARGERVGGNKLTEKDVLEICELLQQGDKSLASIGEIYGVSKHCIFDIKRKKSWSWLTTQYDFK